jgi:ribonucleotide reductase alpha subunit
MLFTKIIAAAAVVSSVSAALIDFTNERRESEYVAKNAYAIHFEQGVDAEAAITQFCAQRGWSCTIRVKESGKYANFISFSVGGPHSKLPT